MRSSLLCLATLLATAPLAAQTVRSSDPAPDPLHPVVVRVGVSSPTVPSVQRLHAPERVLVEWTGATLAGAPRRFPVNARGVEAVRIWADADTVRLLASLTTPQPYAMTADDNSTTLYLGTSDAPAGMIAIASSAQVAHPVAPTVRTTPVVVGPVTITVDEYPEWMTDLSVASVNVPLPDGRPRVVRLMAHGESCLRALSGAVDLAYDAPVGCSPLPGAERKLDVDEVGDTITILIPRRIGTVRVVSGGRFWGAYSIYWPLEGDPAPFTNVTVGEMAPLMCPAPPLSLALPPAPKAVVRPRVARPRTASAAPPTRHSTPTTPAKPATSPKRTHSRRKTVRKSAGPPAWKPATTTQPAGTPAMVPCASLGSMP